MKIAVVAQRFSIGGYRVLYRLLSAIKNNEITLFIDSRDSVSKSCMNSDKTAIDSLKNNGIKIEEINIDKYNWNNLSKRINNFDTALFYWPFFCFCPKNIKIPFYFLIHDLTVLYDFAFPFCDSASIKSNLISFLENGGIPIVLSEYGKKDFHNFFDTVIEPKVIHWSIFSNETSCSEKEENEILEKFNLERKKYFIYPTNNSSHKNIQLCIGIIDVLRKKYPDITCVLCGYGTESMKGNVRDTHIDKHSSDFYNIYGLGIISDKELYVLIKNAVCLITTTFAEGGCGPASDAWLFGTPTVISDIPVLREYSELFGVKTEFASPFNANEFADKIIDIKENEDKYLKIVKHNKKAIVENYTWADVAEKYLSVFNNKGEKKMKIAVICTSSSVGGFRYLYNLLLGIKQASSSVIINVFYKVGEASSSVLEIEGLKANGVSFTTITDNQVNGQEKSFMKSLEDYDVVFYSWPYGIKCLDINKPVFFIPHDFIYTHGFGLDGIGFYDQNMYNANMLYHNTFISNNAIPIVSSDYIKNEFNGVFPNSLYKPNVVYLSTLNDYTKKSDKEVAEFLKSKKIDYDYVLFASNNMPHKNLGNLLGAWYYVKQKYPNLKLLISGYGNNNIAGKINTPYYMDHIDINSEDFDVKSFGLLSNDEFSMLMQGAKMVVNSSLCEAGNGSGLDAWQLGVPVVMSNIEPFMNQIEHLGVKAETFDPRNSSDIARAILYLLDNPKVAEQNVKDSLEAMKKYTWKKVGKQYLDIFEKYLKDYKCKKYLAVTLDYSAVMENFDKEGIVVYTKNLLDALLKNDNSLNLEIWCYSYNVEHCKRIFKDLTDKYASRIKFCDEKLYETDHYINTIYKKKNLKYHLKSGFYNCCYALTKNIRYRQKRQKMKDKLLQNNYVPFSQEELLQKSVQDFSRASYCYIPAVNLKVGRYFSCPKFLQIHDLFAMIPEIEKLFIPLVPNIAEENKKITDNLNDYAKLNTDFITSNVFTRDKEILKYTNIKKSNVNVITFPPMIKQFYKGDLITEKEIRKKYTIDGNYMFYPSQNRPNKNIIVLLKALKKLKDNGIIIKLVTTGRIASYPPDLNFMKDNDIEDLIIETGMMSESDLYALYKYSTLSVVTTKIEGLGMPGQTLEALSLGNIPVICSKCLGVKESLESVGLNFETADLNWFEPDDYEGLAEKIQDVLANPKKHIEKQKGVISYYTKRTWDDVAKDYLELFND
ncbi:glycosyltransferase [bacterium]|nr:glycosyltransferase [bacterium]